MIDQTAIVHSNADIHKNVSIGPYSVIGENVSIGSNCLIGHNTIIEKNVSIGENCSIGSNTIIRNSLIKNNVNSQTTYISICSNPKVVIQNTGSIPLTSLIIE